MADWEAMEETEIKADEGLRLKAYKDSNGILTIGYGHTSDHKLTVTDDLVITQQQADELFEEDFQEAITDAKTAVPFFDALDGPRKGAMTNMAFQMGEAGLAAFHGTLAAMDMQDWDDAARNIMNSKYARQAKARATRIAYRVRTGEYAVRT
jgi:lysozyme